MRPLTEFEKMRNPKATYQRGKKACQVVPCENFDVGSTTMVVGYDKREVASDPKFTWWPSPEYPESPRATKWMAWWYRVIKLQAELLGFKCSRPLGPDEALDLHRRMQMRHKLDVCPGMVTPEYMYVGLVEQYAAEVGIHATDVGKMLSGDTASREKALGKWSSDHAPTPIPAD